MEIQIKPPIHVANCQIRCFFLAILYCALPLVARVELGIDRFFAEGYAEQIKGKRVALVVNHTSVDASLKKTEELFYEHAGVYQLVALFTPEHGLDGQAYAEEHVPHKKTLHNLPVYSLHGDVRRPTDAMLKGIDCIIYDLQDIGVRSYTYASTLFYIMEESAKRGIQVMVLDRPNPIGGQLVDGPMLENKFRSFIGYLHVPYCHGMTIGELARFFNAEYHIDCRLSVISMRGWKRSMAFEDTGLAWIPSSPNIPEADTPLFYASTGILACLCVVNTGVGFTLPYKIVGAPWIDAERFSSRLNAQKLPGVYFVPFHFRPFYGSLKGKDCHGVKIVVTDRTRYLPLTVQYILIGMIKSLYPKAFKEHIQRLKPEARELFCKANGNEKMWEWLQQEDYVAWKFVGYQQKEREEFLVRRLPYLLYN